jgi:hypothetical protein
MLTASRRLPAPPASAPDSLRRERVIVMTLLGVLTALRSAVLVFFEGAHFDSDQALIGLMAKHLIDGRAFPVFTYAQPYMLGVEAWLAAPFLLLGGVTVPMLKLPLLLINVSVSLLLAHLLERSTGLRPALAAVPALFFVLAPPGTSTLLLEASGGNVEPFLMVLLLWVTRRQPLLFGALLAFGILQREFVAYAAGALILLRLMDGSVRRWPLWRAAALSGLSFAAVWQLIYLAKQLSSIDGPGTTVGTLAAGSANVAAMLHRFCADVSLMPYGVSAVLTSHFASIMGAEQRPLVEFGINSTRTQGVDWLWPVVGGSFVLMLGRLGWLAHRRGTRLWQPPLEFPTYLVLVGVQALAVYALFRCGVISVGTMRYSLLGAFAAIGVVAAYLNMETSKTLRRLGIAVTLIWAASAATDHVRLAAEYIADRPVNGRRLLADRLVEEGIGFAYGDYWDSLSTVYLTNEQVIVASTNVVFLEEYQWLVAERSDEAARIERRPCANGLRVVDRLYICLP